MKRRNGRMRKMEKGRQKYKESRRKRKNKKMYRILTTMPLGMSLNSSAITCLFPV